MYSLLVLQAKVTIDTFPSSYGRTNCQFRFDTTKEQANCFVVNKMDVLRFWEVMLAAYSRCVPR